MLPDLCVVIFPILLPFYWEVWVLRGPMDVPAPFSFAFWVGSAQAVGSAAALFLFCLQVLEGAVAATPVLVAAYLLWADPVVGLFPLPAMSASFFSAVASVLNHLFDVIFVDCSHLCTYTYGQWSNAFFLIVCVCGAL